MFYGDILDQLRVGPPFTHFQVQVLNSLIMCLSQLTWNAWAFILVFEVISLHLKVEPSSEAFFFFFSHAQTKNRGWTHFLQRIDRVIIKNMRISVHSWKSLFIKVCLGKGYHPFFLDERCHPCYPFKWSPPIQHEDWSFKNLLPDNQDVMVKLLVVAPLDAQAIISESSMSVLKLAFINLMWLVPSM